MLSKKGIIKPTKGNIILKYTKPKKILNRTRLTHSRFIIIAR